MTDIDNVIIQPNILFKGGVIIITSDSRSELSLLARQTAVELAIGDKWMGIFPATRRQVLHLDLQQSTIPVSFTASNRSDDIGDRLIHVKRAPIMAYTPVGVNEIASLLGKYHSEVTIIECLSDTVPTIMGPKIKRVMINLRALAKQYETCFVLLHDLVKRNWKTRPVRAFDLRGDSILAYEADSIIALTGTGNRFRRLHMVKIDFSPVEITSPLTLRFNPGAAAPFEPYRKNCRWMKL